MNETIILLISNSLTAIAGWAVGRRRSNVETDNMVLKNLELSIGIYVKIIDDLKVEIQSLNLKVQDLEKKVEELYKENRNLKNKNGL